MDGLGAAVPLGEALPGSCIGVLVSAATDSDRDCASPTCNVSVPSLIDEESSSIRVSWLHDAVASNFGPCCDRGSMCCYGLCC